MLGWIGFGGLHVAIDDPVGIVIRDAEQAIAADKSLPSQLVKLGLSAVAAAALVKLPFVAHIVTRLLSSSSARFEARFLRVAEEMNAQQKRIEGKIPDKTYYESEEFQSLLYLILEKLHATYNDEKLQRFGAALANSGSSEFQSEDKEQYVCTLRDLSSRDLQVLNDGRLKNWFPHTHTIEYDAEVLSSLSRLAGMGLVIEKLEIKPLENTGSARMDAEKALREILTQPPKRTYFLSPFGNRFLEFISSGGSNLA